MSKLLSVSADAKTVKGEKKGYLTAVMYLSPFKTVINGASRNVCPQAENAGCYDPCLDSAGRGRMSNVQKARVNRTKAYFDTSYVFKERLFKEIDAFTKSANKKGLIPAVRLNGLSDIKWETKTFADELFSKQPVFYDYTKQGNRESSSLYDLTWSFSTKESYWKSKGAFPENMNWAVVFDTENFPDTFLGRPVINGEENDLRFLDPKGSVVGLKAKGKARLKSENNWLTVWNPKEVEDYIHENIEKSTA